MSVLIDGFTSTAVKTPLVRTSRYQLMSLHRMHRVCAVFATCNTELILAQPRRSAKEFLANTQHRCLPCTCLSAHPQQYCAHLSASGAILYADSPRMYEKGWGKKLRLVPTSSRIDMHAKAAVSAHLLQGRGLFVATMSRCRTVPVL